MKRVLVCVFLVSLVVCCKKKDTEIQPQQDNGYAYFPLSVGLFREYKVIDERFQRGTIDSSIYFLKEELQETQYVSDETQQLVRRYKRTDTTTSWVFDSTWVQATNETNAFYSENSIRFNKLTFPLFKGKQWDFNDYNTRATQTAEAKFVGQHYGGYSEATYIAIDSFFNLVGTHYDFEVYAKNVGLVQKHAEQLNHQPGKDTVGYRIHQNLLRYGQK